jgi:DtxR family Mn-dependent transcriptional regulator
MADRAESKRHTASMEDYLEAIAMLGEDDTPVRVSQISKALGVTMPSVSAALRKLSEDGLVTHERYGYVVLTMKGSEVAEDVFHRHETVRQFLREILGMDAEAAADDACKMEHSLSPDTVNRLALFMEFVSSCPRGEPEWLKAFSYCLEHGERSPDWCAGRCSENRN